MDITSYNVYANYVYITTEALTVCDRPLLETASVKQHMCMLCVCVICIDVTQIKYLLCICTCEFKLNDINNVLLQKSCFVSFLCF